MTILTGFRVVLVPSTGEELLPRRPMGPASSVDPRETTADTPAPPPPAPSAPSDPPRSVKPGESITNSIGMKLVAISSGEFEMGSDDTKETLARVFTLPTDFTNDDEHPKHPVRITRPFLSGDV